MWPHAILHMRCVPVVRVCTCMYENGMMIHHVTQRCALIRMCREVSRAVAIAMDKNAVAKFCSQGLVCVSDLCIRPLKPVDCLLRLPRVLKACAWSAVHVHINGRF